MLFAQRSALAAEPSTASLTWRYRGPQRRALGPCAAVLVRASANVVPGAGQGVALVDVMDHVDGTATSSRSAQDRGACLAGFSGRPELLDPAGIRDSGSVFISQQDVLGHCYSAATVSAMARLFGNHHLLVQQSSLVLLPKSDLLQVLQANTPTSLDEASAALALLVEAGQHSDVIRYGTPLLKAASAAVASAPAAAKAAKPPLPDLEPLTADLALSVALAHVSLAAGQGAPDVSTGAVAAAQDASGSGSSCGPGASGGLHALEELHGHLEAAMQVLTRHGVAEPMQQEVAFCLQNVSVALAEELLRSTPPVSSPMHTPAASPDAAAATAAARRSRAVSLLRGALWKTTTAISSTSQGQSAYVAGPAPKDSGQRQREQAAGGGAAAAHAGGGAAPSSLPGGGFWPPELTAEERCELLAPLRGLLTSAEHIALYGPVASGQKPYAVVRLSDQELYDLAIAHLAQGVSTGWPQHVLQALSYFERVAQQQQQQQVGTAALDAAPAALGPAAADVSFERSVCEALLGRRASAAGAAAAEAEAAALESVSASPMAMRSLDWDWEAEGADEAALLRRLEAQLTAAAGGAAAASFSVRESPSTTMDSDDEGPAAAQQAAPPDAAAAAASAAPAAPGKGDRAAAVAAASRGADASRRYGWAESWLELSVMPCFPETAAGGSGAVSLTRWFADPRVVLFNKLLAVRSSEAQVTAALGSAVAHVSDASRQRLWQLWQAAANAVAGAAAGAAAAAAKGAQAVQPAAAADASTGQGEENGDALTAARSASAASVGGSGSGDAAAPQANGLLAQSRAALQDVGPRAAAAANAVAAAAAALGNAAASSPRAMAAAASSWMVRRGPSLAPAGPSSVLVRSVLERMGRAAAAATAAALPPKAVAAGAAASTGGGAGAASPTLLQEVRPSAELAAKEALERDSSAGKHEAAAVPVPQENNVVPFPASISTDSNPGAATPAAGIAAAVIAVAPQAPTAAPPIAGGLMDVTAAPPPVGSGAAAMPTDSTAGCGAASGASGSGVGALWAPDAEGHLRPRMVARVVHDAAAAAANLRERVAALPAELAALDETQVRAAVRRVTAVAAQAVCLGALAAYVGHRIVASGALQAAAGGGGRPGGFPPIGGDRRPAAVVAADASAAQAAMAARTVGKWLRGMATTVGAAAPGAPRLGRSGAAELELLSADAATVEKVRRLAAMVGSESGLAEADAAALLRGWAAARAAAPGLADPRDRGELLRGLLGGRALRTARAEADRDVRRGRRVSVQRLDVEVECVQTATPPARAAAAAAPPSGSASSQRPQPQEVAATAVVVTAGTQTSRAAPLPEAFSCTERLAVTFRREPGGDGAGGSGGGGVWRLVDVRDAPPSLY